ncbi:MAG: Uma2 family endonuclease [Burkholderiales bacterium]|nr:Uma2 family endonuclease [Burkholderiales bacterium]
MTALTKPRMTVDDFLAWADGREGRWELVDGEVVSMSPERAVHGEMKLNAAVALRAAVAAAGVKCGVLPDSVVVRIDRHTTFQPDVLVYTGARLPAKALEVDTAVIVVEILSPSTAAKDLGDKLAGYFRVPSIHHYLIVDPERRMIIHHKRGSGDVIETRIVSSGAIALDPPGIAITVADVLGEA